MSYKISLNGTVKLVAAEIADESKKNPNSWIRFINYVKTLPVNRGLTHAQIIAKYGKNGDPKDRAEYESFKKNVVDRLPAGTSVPKSFEFTPVRGSKTELELPVTPRRRKTLQPLPMDELPVTPRRRSPLPMDNVGSDFPMVNISEARQGKKPNKK